MQLLYPIIRRHRRPLVADAPAVAPGVKSEPSAEEFQTPEAAPSLAASALTTSTPAVAAEPATERRDAEATSLPKQVPARKDRSQGKRHA